MNTMFQAPLCLLFKGGNIYQLLDWRDISICIQHFLENIIIIGHTIENVNKKYPFGTQITEQPYISLRSGEKNCQFIAFLSLSEGDMK